MKDKNSDTDVYIMIIIFTVCMAVLETTRSQDGHQWGINKIVIVLNRYAQLILFHCELISH